MPTTASGVPYTTRIFTTPSGDEALWGIADDQIGGDAVPFVVYAHGTNGRYDQFATTYAFRGIRDWLIENGWGWVESNGGGGTSWGNAAARQSYSEAFTYVQTQVDIGDVVVLGRSMGGIVAYWLYLYEPAISAKAVGLMINSGTTDLTFRLGAPPGDWYIRTAHGLATDGSDWGAALAEYDPMSFPLQDWDGKNVLQLYGSADVDVPPARHGQAWLDKYGSRCAIADVDIRAGGDHSTNNGSYLQAGAMSAFLQKVTSNPPSEPTRAIYRVDQKFLVGDGGALYRVTPAAI